MRIGMFTDAYTPDINGVVSSIVTLRLALERMGHEVFVITTKPSTVKEETDPHIYRLAGIEIKSMYGYVLTSPIHFAALDAIKKMELDVLHVHTEFGVGIFARIVSNHLSLPLVSTYHTMYEDYTHYVNIFNSKTIENIAKKATYTLSKLYGDKCTSLIVPSEKTKERMEFYGIKKKIHVIPTGLDLARFAPVVTSGERKAEIREEVGVKDDEFMLTYVGRIAEEKSIDFVIDGFVEIKKRQEKIKLVVIGGGPQLEDLHKQVKNLQLEDYVYFTDRRPHTEVPGYYHASDAFVSASLTETQGMTFIEAMASGLIVFARPDDVLTGIVEEDETGYLFKTTVEFADKLVAYAKSTKVHKEKMRKNVIKKANTFDSKVFGENVYDVYKYAIDIYQRNYLVSKIKIKDDMVDLYLSSKDEEIKLSITLDKYIEGKFHKDMVIYQDELEQLKEHEKYAKAYNMCIRKITSKDRTRKEMYDYITKESDLDIKAVNELIDALEQKGYINDYRYMITQIGGMQLLRFGQKRIIRNLTKKGIPYEDIQEVLEQESMETEINRGIKWAEKIQARSKDGSLKMKKQELYKKLLTQGYEPTVATQILERMSFVMDEEIEIQNLEKMAKKAFERYSKKYEGSKLKNSVFRFLISKGFEYDNVYDVIKRIGENKDVD